MTSESKSGIEKHSTSEESTRESKVIMVFGANERGIHGAGAALYAKQHHGAVQGQGFGPQGNSFGLPTCALPVGQPGWEIPMGKIAYYVDCLLLYTKQQAKHFQITQVGCGFVGHTPAEMAPLFQGAGKNCWFDTEWKPTLGETYRYWGTFSGGKYVYTPDFELLRLAAMPDSEIDTTDIPETLDWLNGVRGKYYRGDKS